MLLLAMISTMLYSVLHVGIKYAKQGGERVMFMERERSLLDLFHRQIHGAWYNALQNKTDIIVDDNKLMVVTTRPLLYRTLEVVLAIYLYEPAEQVLYYTEKKDFYNTDYDEDYEPDRDEMIVLFEGGGELSMEYDEEEGVVSIIYQGLQYDMFARCQSGGF